MQELHYEPIHCNNETEVESKFIVGYLLPALGYYPDEWGQQVAFSRIRLDFLVILADQFSQRINFKFIIEVKSPNQNLDNHLDQLKNYLFTLKIQYGLLTNGHTVRLYRNENLKLELVLEIDTKSINTDIYRLREIIGKDKIKNTVSRKSQSSIESKSKQAKMKVISVYHNKGGVGKTTTVVNLAAALSRKGQRVLVIDLDSQANTTYASGLIKFQDELDDDIRNSYVYHLILNKNKNFISEIAKKSYFTTPTFDVVPSHIDLMAHERELIEVASTLFRLPSKLDLVSNDYDIVLIDTPPSLNLYAKVALVASDYLIIPSDLKPFSNEGLINVSHFIEDINEVREQMGKEEIKVLGVLPSKVPTSLKFRQYTLPYMEDNVKNRYGFSLFKTRIFERRDLSAAIERTVSVGNHEIPEPQSIFDFGPNSKSTKEFRNLAHEVMGYIGLN